MRRVLLTLVLVFLFIHCFSATVQNIDATQAKNLIEANKNNSNFIILDVRTPKEFSAGHLVDAINIDANASDFDAKVGKLDKSKKYLVHCA